MIPCRVASVSMSVLCVEGVAGCLRWFGVFVRRIVVEGLRWLLDGLLAEVFLWAVSGGRSG